MKLLVAMPVFEDWKSALALCERLDKVFRGHPSVQLSIFLIDDGSPMSTPPTEVPFVPLAIAEISVLPLLRNLGHQRAICVAIAYLQQRCTGDALVIMDADGEDIPDQIPGFLAAMINEPRPTAVFAERGRRLESGTFRAGYQCYRILHHLLTGRDIRFGNFSVLPWAHLRSLVVMPELWNHYAAGFLKSRLAYIRVPADRGKRLYGHSQMNYISLIVHGLSALFAHHELVGARLLILTLGLTAVLLFLIAAVVGVRLLTNLAIPGWATVALGLLLVLVGQSLIACVTLTFLIMVNRSGSGFIPVRDYGYYVGDRALIYSR